MAEDKKIIVKQAIEEQSQAIHDLMSNDLISAVSTDVLENKKQGFFTAIPSLQQIRDMIIKDKSLFVATLNNKIIGYSGRLTSTYVNTLENYKHLLEYLSTLSYDGKKLLSYNYSIGAGISIAEEARGGRTYFRLLLNIRKHLVQEGLDLFISRIHVANEHSLSTSLRAGCKMVDENYIDKEGERWYIILVDLRKVEVE